MAKRPEAGNCVHCTHESSELTWDHLLPKSWYPDSTPSDLEKWKFPSCEPCNRRYGKLERDILVRFGLCADPRDPRAAGISERALRSIKPEFAADERDRRAREKLREQMQAEMIDFGLTLPDEGIFPGFGAIDGVEYRRFLGVRVSASKLESLGEKFVRGTTFIREGRLITDQHRIEIHFVQDDSPPEVQRIFESHGETVDRGPGFVITRARALDDPLSAVFRIEVWGRFVTHAVVYDRQYQGEVDKLRRGGVT